MSERERRSARDDEEELVILTGSLLIETLPAMYDVSPEQAAEVVLDAVVAWLGASPIDGPPSEFVLQASRDALRQAGREPRTLPPLPPPLSSLLPHEPSVPSQSASESVYDRAIASLNEVERKALLLWLVEKKSYREIAAAMDVTVGYARRLVRGASDKVWKFLRRRHAR